MPLRLRSNKRPNYFTGQLLGQEDFLAEQKYQLDLHRGHAHGLHTWGVVMGFSVDPVDDRTVIVQAGTAIDAQGRLVVLETAQNLTLNPAAPDAAQFIIVRYDEDFDDADRSTDKTENFTRFSELCILDETAEEPADDGSVLVLAKVQFTGGKIIKNGVDKSVRHQAGARLAPGSVATQHLGLGAVTSAKLSAELRGGWVRLPFKPSTFVDPQQQSGPNAAHDFTIGVTQTYCGDRGAKGTMSIPIPVLADRIVNFMIAGASNQGSLSVEVDLCGWNTTDNAHEKITLLKVEIPAKSPFYETFVINKAFDRTRHALALYVEASGAANISLVATEFTSSPDQ
ncbi:MAG TPA: hypothetical protein VFW30_05610 [Bryocella sp.]|nr:hypothetical protein [Bryocella sp.]